MLPSAIGGGKVPPLGAMGVALTLVGLNSPGLGINRLGRNALLVLPLEPL